MLYLIAEQLGFPGVLNLIRYLSFRAGGASIGCRTPSQCSPRSRRSAAI